MNTYLTARIDKSSTRVLCGRPDCGCELAHLVTIPGAIYSDSGASLRSGPETRYVQFGPGWKQDETGLWALSKSALKSWQTDRALAVGNGLTPPELAADARRRLASGRSIANRRPVRNQYTGRLNQARHGIELPALARCPSCTGVVRLDATALDAVSSPGL